jgi:hypothetical protein
MGAFRDAHAKRSLGKTFVIPCPTCNTPTRHTVVAALDTDGGDDDFQYEADYQVVQCDGCQTVSFRWRLTDSESYVLDDYGARVGQEERIRFFPPRLVGHRALADDYFLPLDLRSVYREVVEAAASGFFVLVGIGLRAIVERVCVEEGAKATGFKDKVECLVKMGRLTMSDAALLEPIRDLGNDAAHEALAPSIGDVMNALSVVEHLLNAVYLMKHKAEQLEDSVEMRRRRARKTNGKAEAEES